MTPENDLKPSSNETADQVAESFFGADTEEAWAASGEILGKEAS